MRKVLLNCLLLCLVFAPFALVQWQSVNDEIKTEWLSKLIFLDKLLDNLYSIDMQSMERGAAYLCFCE